MKKTILSLTGLCTAFTLLVLGCSKEDPTNTDDNGNEYIFPEYNEKLVYYSGIGFDIFDNNSPSRIGIGADYIAHNTPHPYGGTFVRSDKGTYTLKFEQNTELFSTNEQPDHTDYWGTHYNANKRIFLAINGKDTIRYVQSPEHTYPYITIWDGETFSKPSYNQQANQAIKNMEKEKYIHFPESLPVDYDAPSPFNANTKGNQTILYSEFVLNALLPNTGEVYWVWFTSDKGAQKGQFVQSANLGTYKLEYTDKGEFIKEDEVPLIGEEMAYYFANGRGFHASKGTDTVFFRPANENAYIRITHKGGRKISRANVRRLANQYAEKLPTVKYRWDE